jgi:hypothetical protein
MFNRTIQDPRVKDHMNHQYHPLLIEVFQSMQIVSTLYSINLSIIKLNKSFLIF